MILFETFIMNIGFIQGKEKSPRIFRKLKMAVIGRRTVS